MAGAQYRIDGNTAIVGKDYAATDGESVTYFPADMTTTALEVELIDDGVNLSKDDTGVYFTVTLTGVQGADGSGIMTGKDVCKVYLYNTSVEKPKNGNIATELYSADETDAGAAVLTTPALATMQDTIVAKAEEKTAVDVVGTYEALFSTEDVKTRSVNYALDFKSLVWNSNYWKDYSIIADTNRYENYSDTMKKTAQDLRNRIAGKYDECDGWRKNDSGLWEFSSHKSDAVFRRYKTEYDENGNEIKSKRSYPGGWEYSSQRSGSMNLSLLETVQGRVGAQFDLNDIYTKMELIVEIRADNNMWGTKGADVLMNFWGDGKHQTVVSHGNKDVKHFTYTERKLQEIQKINFWTDHKGSYDATSWVHLDYGYLQRRTMAMPTVVLHTADDDVITDPKTTTEEVRQDILNQIQPKIGMVSGQGGVSENGEIYVGSKLSITRNDQASSYTFASSNNSLNAVSFSASGDAQKIYTTKAPDADGVAILTLAKKADASDQTQINIYMDRVQDVVLNIRPSVQRQKENPTEIDVGKIDEARASFLSRLDEGSGIAYQYKALDDISSGTGADEIHSMKYSDTLSTGYLYETKDGEKSFDWQGDESTEFVANDVKNVRSINFNLNENDCIVFDGKTYKGNDDIEIPARLYTQDKLEFLYYNEEYLDVNNTMVASITKIERRIDANDNNMWDDGDILLPSLTEESYAITDFSPMLTETGKYHQILLKIEYTMLPRNLFPPDESAANDKAEVFPGLVTTLTNTNGLSAEQQGYRYLARATDGKDTELSSGMVPMYGAEASAVRCIYVALGGDTHPATYNETSGTMTWEPNWTGKSYYAEQFTDPEPIYLDGTPMGDHYPVGTVDTDGKLTAAGKAAVRQYLLGIHENDTVALCVRDTTVDKAKSGENKVVGMESITHAPFKTIPDATSARDLVDPNADKDKTASFDSSGANAPMPEYNMAGQQTMPNLDISLSDYVTIATNGQELSFTIGMPLVSMEKERVGQINKNWKEAEVNGVRDSNSGTIDTVKSVFNSLKGKTVGEDVKKAMKQQYADMKRNQTAAKSQFSNAIKFAGVEGSLAMSISIVVKWDPIDASFHFNQMLVVLAGSIQFSYTAHLTPCPIVYVSVTVGFDAEMALGLEAVRKKVIENEFKPTSEDSPFVFSVATDGSKLAFDGGGDSSWTYDKTIKLGSDKANDAEDGDVYVGAPGATFTVTTTKKAIDIHFNGTLYVDAVAANGSGKVPEGFVAGTISSDGEDGEEATIKLAKSVDGKDNDVAYTVTFTVIDDEKTRVLQEKNKESVLQDPGYAIIDRIIIVSKNTTDVKFSGVNISPSLFMELAIGVGVELFKVELFANISVSCAFAILATDDGDYAGDKNEFKPFLFNEFSMAAALGFRVTALFFNFEFEAVKFMITYDREAKYDEQASNKEGWNFFWYVANRQMGNGKSTKVRTVEDEDCPLTIRVILPGDEDNESRLFSAEDNMVSDKEKAYTPSDGSVPFEYTATFNQGDAFTLGKDMASGTDYKLLTVGDTNYIVYTYTDGESIHASQLVISKVRETVEDGKQSFGLADPTNGTGNYYKLDDDTYGDLDFDAWVVDANTICVAWVSYVDGATTAYDALKDTEPRQAMADAGKYTQVKSVTLTIGTDGKMTAGNVEVVSDNKEGHGLYYMVSGAGDMVFYNEANYYTEDELAAYLAACKAYLGGSTSYKTDNALVVKYGTTDPTVDFQMYYRELNARLYGKTGYPTYALRNADGTYTIISMQSTEWATNGVQIENTAMTKIGSDYYAAFSTAYSKIADNDEMTYRKLYLQKITVDTASGTTVGTAMTVGSPVVLRSLVESDKNGKKWDGVYVNGKPSVAYDDPYFANLNFLTGKLGELTGTPDQFDEILALSPHSKAGREAAMKTFLLFEMNGETMLVPEDSLKSITDETATKRSGAIIPFFQKETAEKLNEVNKGTGNVDVKSAPVLSNVTFGTDSKGNIVAVYTRSVRGTSNNALYMSKYIVDEDGNGSWGNGVMLAMRDMSIYEDAVRNDWTTEEIQEAFNKKYANNEAAVFNFSKVSIGLAASDDDEDDRILVITEGTKSMLEKTAEVMPIYQKTANGIVTDINGNAVVEKVVDPSKLTQEDQDSLTKEESARMADAAARSTYVMSLDENGAYNTENGIYALTFGAGQQALGYASISLTNYNFAPGATMHASVSFTNTGNTTLRGSVNEPLQIDLCLAGALGTGSIATWKVTESVAVGQEVETELTQITIPASMEATVLADSYMYFTVQETGTSEEPFSADTIARKDGVVVSDPACIVIGSKAELAIEKCDIAVVDADDEYVTLSLDAVVTNRGAKDAKDVQMTFAYTKMEKDGGIVSTKLNANSANNLTNGETDISLLSTSEDTSADTSRKAREGSGNLVKSIAILPSLKQSNVTGTFVVPKSCFDTEYGTGSLNLEIDVRCDSDEHTLVNNTVEVSVEPKTMIAAPAKLSMQIGSTLRIPVAIESTTQTAPVIVVEEMKTEGQQNCMSMLYYNSNEKGTWLVIMPAREGEGTIRVKDMNTASFHDICFSVKGEGVFTNIYNDTDIFTWYVPESAEKKEWEFQDKLQMFPGKREDPDTKQEIRVEGVPYCNDLAVAKTNYAFSFKTYATKLDLYFMGEYAKTTDDEKALRGKIKVSSDLDGFADKELFSSDATVPQTVDFGNTLNKAHTVTIAVDSGLVYFDKLLEYINDDLPIYSSKAAPLFTFSRDLPERTSIPDGTEVPLFIYFMDNHGLADVMIDSKSVQTDPELKQHLESISGALWKLDLTELWKTNGSHTIFIQNDSGMTTQKTIDVEWFDQTQTGGDTAEPDTLWAQFVNANGDTVTTAGAEDVYVQLKWTNKDGTSVVDTTGENITIGYLTTLESDSDEVALSQYIRNYKPTEVYDAVKGIYKLPNIDGSLTQHGIYRVTYTDPGTQISSSVLMHLGPGGVSAPKVSIRVDQDGYISVMAQKTLQSAGDSYISTIEVNGVVAVQKTAEEKFLGRYGDWTKLTPAITYNGVYTAKVTDFGGATGEKSITVRQYPMTVTEDVLSTEPAKDYDTEGKLNANGTVTVNVKDGIAQGTYDVEYSTDAEGNIGWTDLAAKYQVAILNDAEERTVEDLTENDWKTIPKDADAYTFDDLAVGTYTVYFRDANAPAKVIERTAEIKQYNVEITSVSGEPSRDNEGGSITITAIGGMGKLEYRMVDADGKVLHDWQEENMFTGLPHGTYYVEVHDTENPNNIDRTEIDIDKFYSVQIDANAGGEVKINGDVKVAGKTYYYLLNSSLEIEAIPTQGNTVELLRVNDQIVEGTTFVIEAITESYVIHVDFGMDYSGIEQALGYHEAEGKYKVKHTITATSGEGGSIAPEGNTIVYYSDTLTYTITPDEGYTIASILVDGRRVPTADTYTFSETTRNHRIHVTFKKIDG